jgi:hypothetical protein
MKFTITNVSGDPLPDIAREERFTNERGGIVFSVVEFVSLEDLSKFISSLPGHGPEIDNAVDGIILTANRARCELYENFPELEIEIYDGYRE